MRLLTLITFLLISTALAESVKTGEYTIKDSGIDAEIFEKVTGLDPKKLELTPKDGKYTFENNGKELSWQVYVPKNYKSSKPAGVLVYINAGDGGKVPGKWKELMDKHNLIWIGADNSGNKFYNYWRVSMALEGLRRIKETYSINEERVYLSGFSGGGRISSLLAIGKPDIFKGGIYNCGCNAPPTNDEKSLKIARENYYVFITGTKDFNLNDTKGVAASYSKNKFDNTKLIIVDGLAHNIPDTKEMDQAIEYLNTPLIEKGKEAMDKAVAAEKRKKIGEAIKWYKKAAGFNVEEAVTKADALQKEIDDLYAECDAAEKERDYVKALQTYDVIYRTYGREIGEKAMERSKALKSDKKVVLEIKAMLYYLKIAKAMEGGNKGEKVLAALKKVVETAPGSKAAELAEKDLKELEK